MWNKLFKKKQSQAATKSKSDESKSPALFKCFSFGSGKKADGERYDLDSRFDESLFASFQQDLEVFNQPDFDKGLDYSQLYQPEQHTQPDENSQLNEIFIEIPAPHLRLDLCPVCSRKFAPESLMKHVIICEKINTKTRKPFDSSTQRLKGTEFIKASSPTASSALPCPYERRISPPKTLSRKASLSSLKSQPISSFDRTPLRGSMSRKSSTTSLASTIVPRVKRSISHQSERCPYCERVFGYKAYDRHVEWCKEKSLIKPSAQLAIVSAAKERMKVRTTYKAPALKTKRGVTRDKYSTSCNGSTNSLADFDSTLNSMSSSMTSENGLYDPFLSAKKQLEELFSPTTTPTTQMINSMMDAPNKPANSNDIMSKSLTLNHFTLSPKTPQPIPKMQTHFKRTSSLRIPNRKPRPAIYTPSTQSNIHCGITDDGPISPCFVRATDYDELPIKSPYSAIKLCEKGLSPFDTSAKPSHSQAMPLINNNCNVKPMMRDKDGAFHRKHLKLDLKNTTSDFALSKTDSLALFLKYEDDLTSKLSEKEKKDKSNSISKRSLATLNLDGSGLKERQKLPDINMKSMMQPQQPTSLQNPTKEGSLISIDNLNKSNHEIKSHSAPMKMINACDNLPMLNSSESDKSRSPSIDRKTAEESSPSPSSRRSGGSSALRRQMKYNIENILFDTDPEPTSSDSSNNNSLQRPSSSKPSDPTAIFDDFDFDQFIASFNDDDQFPIFKDYKMLMKQSGGKKSEVATNNNSQPDNRNASSNPAVFKSFSDTKPIKIERSEAEMKGLEKLDDLCKVLSGLSDNSDENNSLETDTSDSQAVRSKSSADSAYGSLSRHSQSPFDQRKLSGSSMTTFRQTPPPPPVRQRLELKTTEIMLNPVKPFHIQEKIAAPRTVEPSPIKEYSKFCHECGYKFVVPTAKFCIECGVRRIKVD